MFSAKMICAIQILVELNFGGSMGKGINATFLKERCTVASFLVTPVLKSLVKEGYVRRDNKGVLSIGKSLNSVSFYSILSMLHKNMNIGDCSSEELKGYYQINPNYQKLVKVEEQMAVELRSKLESIKISDIL